MIGDEATALIIAAVDQMTASMKDLAEHGRLATDAIVGLRKPLGQLAVLGQHGPRLPRKMKKALAKRAFALRMRRGDYKLVSRLLRWERKTGLVWAGPDIGIIAGTSRPA
jgi:hypothetical protein